MQRWSSFLENIEYLDRIDSTHLHAIRKVETENIATECAIVAKTQTNGIGRCNRKWVSPDGNLFASIIKKPPAQDLGQLSLTAACAIREAILGCIKDLQSATSAEAIEAALKLHWPNDIYYANSKISGILMAMVNDWLIVSVGINVNTRPPDVASSSSLKAMLWGETANESIDILGLFNSILQKIDQWFCLLNSSGFLKIRHYWLQNINEIKCRVVIKNNKWSIEGVFQDIDDCGRLILEKDGNRLCISSGDLFANREGLVINHAENF